MDWQAALSQTDFRLVYKTDIIVAKCCCINIVYWNDLWDYAYSNTDDNVPLSHKYTN